MITGIIGITGRYTRGVLGRHGAVALVPPLLGDTELPGSSSHATERVGRLRIARLRPRGRPLWSTTRPELSVRDPGQEKFPEVKAQTQGNLEPLTSVIQYPEHLPPIPTSCCSLRRGNLASKKAQNKTTTMKQERKISPQVGPGQAGESHTDPSVCPLHNLGGGGALYCLQVPC